MARKTIPLTLESLEDRCVPSVVSNPWPDAKRLTLSFVPDGTPVAGTTSKLFQTMNSQFHTSNPNVWQKEIVKAFSTWAKAAKMNITVVKDGGQPIGAAGDIQGDKRFGDIRIVDFAFAAADTDPNEPFAVAHPFDNAAGTLSGDVYFNTAANFDKTTAGALDLYTVALHEAGHALGVVAHDSDVNSVMAAGYSGAKSGLTASDIAGFTTGYVARTSAASNNNTFDTATAIAMATTVNDSINFASDVNYYKLTVSANPGPVIVDVATSGISALQARVSVYDSNQTLIATSVAPNFQGDIGVHLGGLTPNSTYYIKVEGGTTDALGVGAYQMQVHLDGTVFQSNVEITNLYASQFRGTITSGTSVDVYTVTAPAAVNGLQNIMTVMSYGVDDNALNPNIKIYNASMQLISADVLISDGSSNVVQLPVTAGAVYYIAIGAANPTGSNNTGKYFTGVTYSTTASQQAVIDSGIVNTATAPKVLNMAVAKDLTYHFVLSAAGFDSAAAQAALQLRGFNSSNIQLFEMTAAAGTTKTMNVFMLKGTYTLDLSAIFTGKQRSTADISLFYILRGMELSRPIDPVVLGSTTSGVAPPPTAGPLPSYTTVTSGSPDQPTVT